MSNLLKLKFISKTIFLVVIFVGVFAFSGTADAYTHTVTLTLGSTGSQVTSLQNRLGISPTTGDFDYTTRGKVVEFQLGHGLVADGIVGPITGKALSTSSGMVLGATSSVPSSYALPSYLSGCTSGSLFSSITGKLCKDPLVPAGCVSNIDYNEYSTVTGMSCAGSIVYQAGCSSEYGYSITTGKACSLPIGCTSTTGYSKLTGKSCSLTNTYTPLFPGCTLTTAYSALTGASCTTGYTPSPLSGSAGSINDVERVQDFSNIQVPEDTIDAFLAGYIIFTETGSDLKLSSIKISIQFTTGDASRHLDKYADNISVLLNGMRVGRVDTSSLSENDDIYTATIKLSDAVVVADYRAYLYIGADTVEDISLANEENNWTITLIDIRYTDATGASMNDSSLGDIGSDGSSSFHFLPILDYDNDD
jgi:peptidoglycan hydrolase-like protein with peptidoglycan-binding domain